MARLLKNRAFPQGLGRPLLSPAPPRRFNRRPPRDATDPPVDFRGRFPVFYVGARPRGALNKWGNVQRSAGLDSTIWEQVPLTAPCLFGPNKLPGPVFGGTRCRPHNARRGRLRLPATTAGLPTKSRGCAGRKLVFAKLVLAGPGGSGGGGFLPSVRNGGRPQLGPFAGSASVRYHRAAEADCPKLGRGHFPMAGQR